MSEAAAAYPNLKPFKPGQSGNPSGRPKGIASQAREMVKDDPTGMLAVLLEVAQDPDQKASDRVAAAKEFMDRAWGKTVGYEPQREDDPLGLSGTRERLMGRLEAVPSTDDEPREGTRSRKAS